MARANAPQPVSGASGFWRMVGQTFVAQHIAVVVNARPHHAAAQRHVVHGLKRRHGFVHEVIHRLACDLATVHRGTSTPMCGLFDQHHTRARVRRSLGRLQTGDAATNHQHITERVEMFISVRVRFFGRSPQTGGLANERLVDVFPQRARVHESLVIETRRHEPRHLAVDRAHVELKAGPVVLAFGGQTVEQFGRGDALVWLERAALPQIDQAVRLFRAAGDNAARTVIFETAAHQHLVIRQKRRGQRVALEPLHVLAVESKGHSTGFVQQATACGKTGAH